MPNPSFEHLTESIGLLILSVLCIGKNMVTINLFKELEEAAYVEMLCERANCRGTRDFAADSFQ